MAKPKQRYGICIVCVCSMAYASAAQAIDGAMLPHRETARCLATVVQPQTNVVRYLCGGGENADVSGFGAPDSRIGAPRPFAMPFTDIPLHPTPFTEMNAGHAPGAKTSVSADRRRPRAPLLAVPAGAQTSPDRSRSSALAAPRWSPRRAIARRCNPCRLDSTRT
jgi:hypothetical protein